MKFISYILILSILISACNKFTEVDAPPSQISTDRVFESDATAIATLSGILSEMMNGPNQFTSGNTMLFAGMAADELSYFLPSIRDEFINNALTEASHSTLDIFFWSNAYKYIYSANLSIEKLDASTKIIAEVKSRLKGEAFFIRAFCHFYLTNLFGDIPIITSTDYRINSNLARQPVEKVYEQILQDLELAMELLPDSYAGGEKVRPNKWAALALLSRANLYMENWSEAEAYASEIITSGVFSLPNNPEQVFLKNSAEAIWQLLPVNPNQNTWVGFTIIPGNSTSTPSYIVRPELVDAFENGDSRASNWLASRLFQNEEVYHPVKYKVRGGGVPITEYYMVLRLAEQYLIRAEARARQNKFGEAIVDVNIIRERASLQPISFVDAQETMIRIAHERRIELFAEWGHRWFDLNRTGAADTVLANLKPGNWQSTDKLWPIPIQQLQANPQLNQNDGY